MDFLNKIFDKLFGNDEQTNGSAQKNKKPVVRPKNEQEAEKLIEEILKKNKSSQVTEIR